MAGALVEPGRNAVRAAWVANLSSGDRALVLSPGTIGLLVAMFARSFGAEVHLLGATARSLEFSRSLGFAHAWTESELPDLAWDVVIDCATAPYLPRRAVDLVEPAKRVVYIGLAGAPSQLDTRNLVLKDVTAVGILSGSGGLAGAIDIFSGGEVDQVGAVLAGERIGGAGQGPKVHVDPHL